MSGTYDEIMFAVEYHKFIHDNICGEMSRWSHLYVENTWNLGKKNPPVVHLQSCNQYVYMLQENGVFGKSDKAYYLVSDTCTVRF